MRTFILFTYGTLMRGEKNAHLLKDARYIGKAKTKACYNLLSIPGNYPFPALMEKGNLAIEGELYEASIEARDYMDQIEGHPYNYCRKPVDLDVEAQTDPDYFNVLDCKYMTPVAYFLVNKSWTKQASPILSGDWRKR